MQKRMEEALLALTGAQVQNLCLLREKNGVHVCRGTYRTRPVVIKYFENEADKREIQNYRILSEHGIPTVAALAMGESWIILEDVNLAADWRLGVADDMQDITVANSLADWYFRLHEAGASVPQLAVLYCEYDMVTEASIAALCGKLPSAVEALTYILARYPRLRECMNIPRYTLAYNDFYWTNLVVRKDKQAALMLDYNLLGKGYRYTDLRNVCSSLSEAAAREFYDAYHRLYRARHGTGRTEESRAEERVDRVASCLFTLITAFEREAFPSWAEEAKGEASDGRLLAYAKNLLA